MTWSNATVHFHFEQPNGNPAKGTVTFTPNSSVILDAAGHITYSGPQTFDLDETGSVTVAIPPTDTTELLPASRQWKIAVRLRHTNRVPTLPGLEFVSGQTYYFDQLVAGVEAAPVFDTWLTETQYAALVGRVAALESTPPPSPIGFDTDGTPYLIGA